MLKRLGFTLCAAGLLTAAQVPNALGDMSEALQNLTRKVSPAVVKVLVTSYGPTSDDEPGRAAVIRRQHAVGSGAIVDSSGYIVTNAHVVERAEQVAVVLRPAGGDEGGATAMQGRTLKATIVGTDPIHDIAVLKVDATGLPTLPLGDYRKVRQGQLALAFGSPQGLEDSVTMGVVSSVTRQPDPDLPMIYIQTDAAVNPGNSGGPLVNVAGEMIGMNTFIVSASGGSQGTNFAIPSTTVNFVYQEILAHGHVHRRVLGIRPQAVTSELAAGLGLPDQRGLIISDVLPGGPAEKAGVNMRDILLQIDGEPINSLPDYEAALNRASHGDSVTLDLLRGAQKISLKVAVVEQPQNENDDLVALVDPRNSQVRGLGILGLEVNDKIAQMIEGLRIGSGVVVVALSSQTGLERGFQPGDVIHEINGAPVVTLAGLREELARLKPGDPVALHLEREGQLVYMGFEME